MLCGAAYEESNRTPLSNITLCSPLSPIKLGCGADSMVRIILLVSKLWPFGPGCKGESQSADWYE